MVLYGRERARALEEVEELEAFYDVSMETPEYRRTVHLPRAQGGEEDEPPTVYLNPVIPGTARHETRHFGHYAVVRDVVADHVEETIDYYEAELADLSPSYGIHWAVIRGMSTLAREPGADAIYKKVRAGEDDPDTVANLVLTANAETNLQHEVFATRGGALLPLELGAATLGAVGNAVRYGQDIIPELPALEAVPETYAAAAGSAALAPMIGRDLQHWAQGEKLVEDSLTDLDARDRRRAMFHNSRLDRTIDATLERLASHGIE